MIAFIYSTRCHTWFTVTESQPKEAPHHTRTEFPGPFGEIPHHSPTRSLGSPSTARECDRDLSFLRRVRILEPPPTRPASNHGTIDATQSEGAIACLCGDTNRVGLTIECATCPRWYHAACIDVQINVQTTLNTASWRCWVCATGTRMDVLGSARTTGEESDDDNASKNSTKEVTVDVAGGVRVNLRMHQSLSHL